MSNNFFDFDDCLDVNMTHASSKTYSGTKDSFGAPLEPVMLINFYKINKVKMFGVDVSEHFSCDAEFSQDLIEEYVYDICEKLIKSTTKG